MTENEQATPSADDEVGANIRNLRQARGLSIKDIAERSGLSIALISQIERGISSASVRVLARLADGLDVAISDLFEPPAAAGANDRIVARRRERQRVSTKGEGVMAELLTPFAMDPRLDILLLTIEPDGQLDSVDQNDDFGHEAGVVLEGGIELYVEGRRYVLGQGDSFRFSSERPYRFLNAGRKMAQVVWTSFRQ